MSKQPENGSVQEPKHDAEIHEAISTTVDITDFGIEQHKEDGGSGSTSSTGAPHKRRTSPISNPSPTPSASSSPETPKHSSIVGLVQELRGLVEPSSSSKPTTPEPIDEDDIEHTLRDTVSLIRKLRSQQPQTSDANYESSTWVAGRHVLAVVQKMVGVTASFWGYHNIERPLLHLPGPSKSRMEKSLEDTPFNLKVLEQNGVASHGLRVESANPRRGAKSSQNGHAVQTSKAAIPSSTPDTTLQGYSARAAADQHFKELMLAVAQSATAGDVPEQSQAYMDEVDSIIASYQAAIDPSIDPSSTTARVSLDYARDNVSSEETVLYLAYGSNLSSRTFQGARGIRPLSQINVVVPELVLIFDLPGIPYVEPCFANTQYRNTGKRLTDSARQKKSVRFDMPEDVDYRKDKWRKGLVGVVYEVTKKDYARIIATEGGGASYQDVLVNCYPLSRFDHGLVPERPSTKPFKAHTLYSPAIPSPPPGNPLPSNGGRISRPEIEWAQPSARYLKLIVDGAKEHGLPEEYQRYLSTLRPYVATSAKQKLGQSLFLSMWGPILAFIFYAGEVFRTRRGASPTWFVQLSGVIFEALWASYDYGFNPVFGEGEHTIPEVKVGYIESIRRRMIGYRKFVERIGDVV